VNVSVVKPVKFVDFVESVRQLGVFGALINESPPAPDMRPLSLFKPGKFHLVLTDLTMLGMTGDKVAAEIKSRAPTQPVVAITGQVESLRRSPIQCFDGYIGKPFALTELRALIERYSVPI
jgi:CheY-like chemotaxis protein